MPKVMEVSIGSKEMGTPGKGDVPIENILWPTHHHYRDLRKLSQDLRMSETLL